MEEALERGDEAEASSRRGVDADDDVLEIGFGQSVEIEWTCPGKVEGLSVSL